jgi:hypothetical protein
VTAETLLSAFASLAPWPPRGDLSDEEWDRYIAAAREVQASGPGEVERALADFLDAGDDDAETKLFLLSRIVFDLPERAPAEERRTWKGWINWPDPAPDGTVNLSWPVRWDGSRPALEAGFEGAEGPRYAAVEEYRDLRERFALRELREVAGA